MKSKKIKDKSDKNRVINNYIKKDNDVFLENEISIIIKKIRKELNTNNKIYKNHKLDFLQATNEYKIENNRFKKINNVINISENEVEYIHKKIAKIKKQKIYAISSILKFRKLYNKSNLEKYKSILFVGLSGPNYNFENLNFIIENEDEFNYYLTFLEKYYVSLEKENKIKFFCIKNIVNDLINDENISFPEDKLLLYLSYIIQIIDYENELKKKSEKLKNEELKKIELSSKLRDLESIKTEKNNLINKMSDYIDLLKNLIDKYKSYQKKYKNNLISKETLYKKIRKLQSINLQNFQVEKIIPKNNKIFVNESIQSKISVLPYNNRYSNLNSKNKNYNELIKSNILPHISQNISRNISVDYLPEVGKPLTKKNNFEKNEIDLNDIFFTLSIDKSDITEDENVSENSEVESPMTTINITSRKKSLTKIQISNKTTIDNHLKSKKNPISEFSINDLNKNKTEIKKKDSQILYHRKKANINMCIIKPKTKEKTSDFENLTRNYNENSIDGKSKENENKIKRNDNQNKDLYYFKRPKKNNKFSNNKVKLFNKYLSKTIVSNKEKLNILHDTTKMIKFNKENKLNKTILKNCINSCDIEDINNNKKSNNNIIIQKINNYYGPIYPNHFDDTIKSVKEEINQKNYSFINNNTKIRNHNIYPSMKFNKDFKTENCCISCI